MTANPAAHELDRVEKGDDFRQTGTALEHEPMTELADGGERENLRLHGRLHVEHEPDRSRLEAADANRPPSGQGATPPRAPSQIRRAYTDDDDVQDVQEDNQR